MKKTLHDYEWLTDVRIGDLVEFHISASSGNETVKHNGVVVGCANKNPECFFVEAIDGNSFTVFPFEMKILSRVD